MKTEKIAENIVDGLSNLENKSSSISKISHTYKNIQIAIVLDHLHPLTDKLSKQNNAWICPKCLDEVEGYTDDHCVGCGKSIISGLIEMSKDINTKKS